MGRTGVTL